MDSIQESSSPYAVRCKKHTAAGRSGVVSRDRCHLGTTLASCSDTESNVIHTAGVMYCDEEPDIQLLQQFKERKDNQIASLEILSIALGVH